MPTAYNARLVKFDALALGAATFLLDQARAAIAARGLFRFCLSGGETPAAVYAEMARLGGDLPWDKVQITFGDERCVPPDHAQSNYAMARRALLDQVPIPAGNVFRIRGELDPERAAREYAQKLAAMASRFGEPLYVHDLVLLGIGPDGHTASLFPGSPALEETQRALLPVIGPKPPPQRVTMTFPILNAARQVCFLSRTAGKQSVIEDIFAGRGDHPAARVRPASGEITWLLAD